MVFGGRFAAKVSAHMPTTADDDGDVTDRIESGQLVIRIRRDAEALTLELHGELDLASAPALQEQLDAAAADGSGPISVVLRQLEFLASTGLRARGHAQTQLTDSGREIVLRRGSPAVQRLFELSRMDRLFRFLP